MIDIKQLRANPEKMREVLVHRNISFDLDAFLALDTERLGIRQSLEVLQSERNRVSKEIPQMGGEEKDQAVRRMKEVNFQISEKEQLLTQSEQTYCDMLYALPNYLDPTTAIGKDDTGNVVESTV